MLGVEINTEAFAPSPPNPDGCQAQHAWLQVRGKVPKHFCCVLGVE